MRPLQLDIEGFGAFRDRVTIDFEGIDFFALVGPTGSGKSTVIDAMCFALYGSVPRYNNKSLIHPTLSTGASEARVSFRFAVGEEQFKATRVARRTSAGGGAFREVRLENLSSDGQVLSTLAATVTEIDRRIPELVGLSFDHFTRCVALPQGEFAKFLHDSPSDRQQVLVKLLRLDVYRIMMQAANARAAAADTAATALGARIDELGDLSDATHDAASTRRATVEALERSLSTTGESLAAFEASAAAAEQAIARADEEITKLEAIRTPASVATLATALFAAMTEHERALAATQAAEDTVEETRSASTALPSRQAIESAVRDWDELANSAAASRRCSEALVAAEAAMIESANAVAVIDTELDATRSALEPLHALHAIRTAHDELQRIQVAIAGNDSAVASAGEQHTALRAERDDLDDRRRNVGQEAKNEGALTTLAGVQRRHSTARRVLDESTAERNRLTGAARLADEHNELAIVALTEGRHALTTMRRAHAASAIAMTLAIGDDCPVCHHTITELGGHDDLPALNEATSAVSNAETTVGKAAKEAETQHRALSRIDAIVDEHTRRAEELSADLSAAADALGHPELTGDAAKIAAMLEAATGAALAHQVIAAELDGIDKQIQAIEVDRAALVATGSSLRSQIPLQESAATGEPDVTRLASRIAAAEVATERVSQLARSMATAQRQAGTDRERLAAETSSLRAAEQQHAVLITRCEAHRLTDILDAQLLAVGKAESAQAAAITSLKAAQSDLSTADAAVKICGREQESAWTEFRAARDVVAAFGPPPHGEEVLAVAWGSLERWTQEQGSERRASVDELRRSAAQSKESASALRAARVERVHADLGVALVSDAATNAFERVVTTAHAAATSEVRRIDEGRARTAALRVEQDQRRADADVAHMLGHLLSSKNFEKWLVSTALRSLTASASVILERLSDRQYGLESTDGNDFLVIDHRNADERRPVRSLSGGETFQASLALALALSQEISALSTQPGHNLDSIFLDEGFGTLDPETLDSVADTIETLGRDGRMVGIITHVRELAERVPVRFRVTKGERTSTIEVETG